MSLLWKSLINALSNHKLTQQLWITTRVSLLFGVLSLSALQHPHRFIAAAALPPLKCSHSLALCTPLLPSQRHGKHRWLPQGAFAAGAAFGPSLQTACAAMTKAKSDNRTKVFVCELLIRSRCLSSPTALLFLTMRHCVQIAIW